MDCFTSCLARNAGFVALATLLGFAVGVIGSTFLICLATEGVVTVGSAGSSLWILGTVTLACMGTLLLGSPIPWIVGGIGALIGLVAASAIVALECSALCESQPAAGVVDGGGAQGALTEDGDLSCASATAAVEALEDQLAAARADRDARQTALDEAATRTQTARTAMLIAGAALAATPFWNLLAVAAATTAVAAATLTWKNRQKQLAEASAALAAAQVAVAGLEGSLASAKAAQSKACTDDEKGGVPIVAEVGVPAFGA